MKNTFPLLVTLVLCGCGRYADFAIKRRVRMLGGDLVVESKPGEGSKLELKLPL